MAFKMKSGMRPSFKSMGSSPVKQYADKNVSVDKVSDDGRTFTGTDSKGKTGKYKTSGYDAEVMQSDSVGVTGDAVSNMQMEYDMVKGTKYEKDFIDYHGKGNKPGTGKSPAKQRDRNIDPKFTVKPHRGSRDIDPKFTIRGKDTTNDPLDPRERDKRSGKEKLDALTKKIRKSPAKQGVKKNPKDNYKPGIQEPLSKREIRRIKRKSRKGKGTTDPEYNKPSEVEIRFKGASPAKPGDRVVKLPTAVVTPRENTESPAKSRADRKAGRAAKAAQKHAQAEDRGKSRKADRQAVKVAKHGGHAEAAGTSSGTPVLQKSPIKQTPRIPKLEPIRPTPQHVGTTGTLTLVDGYPAAKFKADMMREDFKRAEADFKEFNDKVKNLKIKPPTKQTSHGPIREFNPPRNPNEGPYIVRSKPTGQTREPNNDGPDYKHIRLDDGPHPQRIKPVGPSPHQIEILGGRPKQLRNYDAMIEGVKSPNKQADDGSNPKPPKPTSKKQETKKPPETPDPRSTKLASGKVIPSSKG